MRRVYKLDRKIELCGRFPHVEPLADYNVFIDLILGKYQN